MRAKDRRFRIGVRPKRCEALTPDWCLGERRSAVSAAVVISQWFVMQDLIQTSQATS